MGEALSSYGLQTVTTVCYAYSTDVLTREIWLTDFSVINRNPLR